MVKLIGIVPPKGGWSTEEYEEVFYLIHNRREYRIEADEQLIEELKLIKPKGFLLMFSDVKPYLEAIGETWEFIGKGAKL